MEMQTWVTEEVKIKAKKNNRKRPSVLPRRNGK